MVLSRETLPALSAVVTRLEVPARTGSTNADLVRAVAADPLAWPHLSAIATDDQSGGRGRLGRSWTAPPGSALALSLVLRVDGLPVESRGWVPLIAGVGMARAVDRVLRGRIRSTQVKWPNDVLVDGLKISGVLAEVVPGVPDAVVVGAGVNTTMAASELPVPTAVSFAVLGMEVSVDELAAVYAEAVRDLLAALVAARGDADSSGIRETVAGACGTIGSAVVVTLPGNTRLEGRATGLGPGGELVVTADGVEHAVLAGDVVHVR